MTVADLRHRSQQAFGVGMSRVGEQRLDRRLLDDLPGVHHRDPVAEVGNHAEVVGDEQDRQVRARAGARGADRGSAAWTVTSRAVVGSSAISSFGSQMSAIAIMTRWRMPPESWCG